MSRLGHLALIALLGVAAAGCSRANPNGVVPGADLGVAPAPDLSVGAPLPDGGGAIFAGVGFTGCASVAVDGGAPRCIGPAPLSVKLVAIAPGDARSFLWTTPGGAPPSSKTASPTVTWSLPGTWPVSLVVEGAAGQASAEVAVHVLPAGISAACSDDRQCGKGLSCLCAPDADGGACPGELGGGLCTRACIGDGCAMNETCVDLSRSVGGDPNAAAEAWRHPFCLRTCAAQADCRAGFQCRDLPSLATGAVAGGPYVWKKACFPALLGEIGASCADADGKPTPSSCAGGVCLSVGARGQCASPCDGLPCPDQTVCVTFTGDPTRPVCIPRCDQAHACNGDPLIACQAAKPDGAWGITPPRGEPNGATYCTPKRCAMQADCAVGRCLPGNGAPSFCLP